MTGAPSRISTPASRAARAVRQGDTRRANLELALLAGALVAFLLAVARLAAGHVIDAPGPIADADVVRTWWGFTLALSRSAAIVAFGFLVAHVDAAHSRRHRRSLAPADRLRAVRPRPADDGQRQRSVARAAALRAVRDRRRPRLRRADGGQPGRLRPARAAPLRLRVPDRRARPVGAAAGVRLGPRPQRRQGEPVRRAAGRGDPAAHRALPGRLLRASLGMAARAGGSAGAAASDPEAAAPAARRRRDPGGHRHGAGAAVLLLPARPRPGAGPRLHLPRHLQRRPRSLGPGRASAWRRWSARSRGLRPRLPVDGRQAHRHVAFAVGQRRQRRRSGGARVVGPRLGRACSAAASPRRARATSRPARTIWCSPASARSSASPACCWCWRCSRRWWCGRLRIARRTDQPVRRAARRRPRHLARGADAADRRRPARPAAALRRGHAVPQPGPIVDGVEPRRRRPAAGGVAAGAAGRGEAVLPPGVAPRAGGRGAARRSPPAAPSSSRSGHAARS